MAVFGERRIGGVIGAVIGVAVGLAGSAGAASAGPVALHCMNTTSGATWDIPVDLTQGTVDSVPAQITDGSISWLDTTFHHYDFDRRTGLLDMHVASSTGGFYLTDKCVLK
jgi:hypothetical protein